jgi:hypothetical protein
VRREETIHLRADGRDYRMIAGFAGSRITCKKLNYLLLLLLHRGYYVGHSVYGHHTVSMPHKPKFQLPRITGETT